MSANLDFSKYVMTPPPAGDDLPPSLVSGILKNESGGKHYDARGNVKLGPVTRSGKRAIGKWQVMPDALGGRTRAIGGQTFDLYDEAQNEQAGRAYLSEGLKAAGGDEKGAALYYFGGPGALRRYQRSGRIPQGDDLHTTMTAYVRGATGQDTQTLDFSKYVMPSPTPTPEATPAPDFSKYVMSSPAAPTPPVQGEAAGASPTSSLPSRGTTQSPAPFEGVRKGVRGAKVDSFAGVRAGVRGSTSVEAGAQGRSDAVDAAQTAQMLGGAPMADYAARRAQVQSQVESDIDRRANVRGDDYSAALNMSPAMRSQKVQTEVNRTMAQESEQTARDQQTEGMLTASDRAEIERRAKAGATTSYLTRSVLDPFFNAVGTNGDDVVAGLARVAEDMSQSESFAKMFEGLDPHAISDHFRKSAYMVRKSVEKADELSPMTATQKALATGADLVGNVALMEAAANLGGSRAAFGGVGFLSARGRGESYPEAIGEGVKQEAIRNVFEHTANMPLVQRAATVYAATVAIEKASGATDDQAVKSAATNAGFVGLPEAAGRAAKFVANPRAAIQRGIESDLRSGQPTDTVAPPVNVKARERGVPLTVPEGGRAAEEGGAEVSGVSMNPPEAEAPPQHHELQPRRVRKTETGTPGQFKKETATQREARRAQVGGQNEAATTTGAGETVGLEGQKVAGGQNVESTPGEVSRVPSESEAGAGETEKKLVVGGTPVKGEHKITDADLRSIRDPAGDGIHHTAQEILDSPYKEKILAEIGSARPSKESTGGNIIFLRPDGARVEVRSGAKNYLEPGEKYFGEGRYGADPGVVVNVGEPVKGEEGAKVSTTGAEAQVQERAKVESPHDVQLTSQEQMNVSFIHKGADVGSEISPLTAEGGQQFFKERGFWFFRNEGGEWNRVTTPDFATRIEKWSKEIGAQTEKSPRGRTEVERPNPRTGLTKTQTNSLASDLEGYAERHLIGTENYPKVASRQEGAELLAGVARGAKHEPIARDFGKPETFKVPDDGEFTVRTVEEANRLHQKITGEPIEGLPKPQGARTLPLPQKSIRLSAREQEANTDVDAIVQAYGSAERAHEALSKVAAQLDADPEVAKQMGGDRRRMDGIINELKGRVDAARELVTARAEVNRLESEVKAAESEARGRNAASVRALRGQASEARAKANDLEFYLGRRSERGSVDISFLKPLADKIRKVLGRDVPELEPAFRLRGKREQSDSVQTTRRDITPKRDESFASPLSEVAAAPRTPVRNVEGERGGSVQEGREVSAGNEPTTRSRSFPKSAEEGDYLTGAKVAVTRAERERLGQSQADLQAWKSVEDSYNAGRSQVEEGRVDPQKVAEEVAKKPRPLTADEVGALTYERAKILTQHDIAFKDALHAMDAKNEVDAAEARVRMEGLEERLRLNSDALEKGGREQSAAFNARKMLVKADYSLAQMVDRYRAETGREPSAEVRAKIETQAARIKELEGQLAEYQERQSAKGVERLIENEKTQVRRTRRTEDRKKLDEEYASLKEQFAQARAKIKSVQPSGLAGLDPEGELTSLMMKMARNRVRSGIVTAEGLVDEIYSAVKEHVTDLTKRDVRDALSGYGKTAEMSKEPDAVQLRELKWQMRLISSLEDAQAGQRPLRSGLQRDVQSERVKELSREVQRTLREQGIRVERTPQDAESRQKSALDAVKTRLRSEINDLDKQLAGAPARGRAKPVAKDVEATGLQAERDTLKRSLEDPAAKNKEALRQRINEVERRLRERDYSAREPEFPSRIYDDTEASRMREQLKQLNSQLSSVRLTPERKAALARTAIEKQVADLERRINQKDFSSRQKAPISTPELDALRAKRDALREQYEDLRPPMQGPKDWLPSAKKQLQKRIDEYERKIRAKDFSKRERPEVVYDREGNRLKVQLESTKQEYENLKERDRLQNRPGWEKSLDLAVRWGRFAKLTYLSTMGKLTNAATGKVITNPLEEMVGGIESKVMPGLARRAPREGGLSIKAEVESISRLWRKESFRAFLDKLKTGQSDLDLLYGSTGKALEEQGIGGRVLGVPGRAHGAMKELPRQAEFYRAFEKRLEYKAREGQDIKDPIVQQATAMEAYADAQRTILMQPNFISDAFNRTMRSWEREGGSRGKVAAKLMRLEFPLTRIPVNFAGEALNYTFGSVRAGAQTAYLQGRSGVRGLRGKGFKSGFAELTPEQADSLMRAWKKGGVGLGMVALGFMSPGTFGGYYQKGEKRDRDEPDAGELRLFGHNLPRWAGHIPILEAAQFGATMRRVYDATMKKEDSKLGASESAIIGAGEGLLKEVPFYEDPLRFAEAVEGKAEGVNRFAGQQVRGMIPGAFQEASRYRDRYPSGETVKRKREGFVDEVIEGTPWRKNLSIGPAFGTQPSKGSEEVQRLGMQVRGVERKDDETAPKYEARKARTNPAIGRAIDRTVSSGRYQNLPDEKRREAIRGAIRDAVK